ncbi:MAG: glycosyltransferase [Desulfobacteraceae bacterium]|nr:glycosyltransferase [Desulfobacteraceae bacterium]
MNIAVVVRTLRIGGMERVAANLSDAFKKNGHNVTLIYLKDKPVQIMPDNKDIDIRLLNLEKLLLKTGVGIILIGLSMLLNIFLRKSLFVWKGFFQSKIFFRELGKIEEKKGRFDLIIARGQGTFELIWNNSDPRVIQVCENIFREKHPGFLGRFYARLLFNGKKVVCVSNGVFEDFIEFQNSCGLKPELLKMITNPIDIESIRDQSKFTIKEIPDYPFILGLGRFVPQKNFYRLIKAYRILADEYKIPHKLVLAGDGKEKNALVSFVKELNLESSVYFPGFAFNPYAWMASSSLFVLSSDFEGLGMVIIEAFAAGTNVVAVNSPGGVKDIMMTKELKEQLSDFTPESLALVIYKTLNKPVPHEEIRTVLDKFSPDFIVAEYLDLIDSSQLSAQ